MKLMNDGFFNTPFTMLKSFKVYSPADHEEKVIILLENGINIH